MESGRNEKLVEARRTPRIGEYTGPTFSRGIKMNAGSFDWANLAAGPVAQVQTSCSCERNTNKVLLLSSDFGVKEGNEVLFALRI